MKRTTTVAGLVTRPRINSHRSWISRDRSGRTRAKSESGLAVRLPRPASRSARPRAGRHRPFRGLVLLLIAIRCSTPFFPSSDASSLSSAVFLWAHSRRTTSRARPQRAGDPPICPRSSHHGLVSVDSLYRSGMKATLVPVARFQSLRFLAVPPSGLQLRCDDHRSVWTQYL
jgi:hypothetical protein